MTKKQNSKAGCAGGKQVQGIKTVRSGPWWVTILEKGKGIQNVPLHLFGEMLKLWENKWATETDETEIDMNWLWVDNKFH
jgi:hypothetical protein